jgi:hypothetical protein
MYFDYPVYNAALESERNIINSDHIERVAHHADVPVDPGAVSTPCVEFFFIFGTSAIILLDYDTVRDGLNATFGVISADGYLT